MTDIKNIVWKPVSIFLLFAVVGISIAYLFFTQEPQTIPCYDSKGSVILGLDCTSTQTLSDTGIEIINFSIVMGMFLPMIPVLKSLLGDEDE